MTYQTSYSALRIHVMDRPTVKNRKTDCHTKHNPGVGRPNFYEYQKVKDKMCKLPTDTREICGAMFKNKHNLDTHMSTEHRYSFQTKSCSLDLASSKMARKHVMRKKAKEAKQTNVQDERPPTKKPRTSKKHEG